MQNELYLFSEGCNCGCQFLICVSQTPKLDKIASPFEFGSEIVKWGWCGLNCVVLDVVVSVDFECKMNYNSEVCNGGC